MSRLIVAILAIALLSGGCTGGPNTRTVLVDYSHDEFASFMAAYFPRHLTAAAGDTVVFKQTWTGEPHTVTGGTLVNEMMGKSLNLMLFSQNYHALLARGVKFNLDVIFQKQPDAKWADSLGAVEQSSVEPFRTRFLAAYDGLVDQGVPIPPRGKRSDVTNGEVVKIFDKEFPKLGETKIGELPDARDVQNARQPCFLTQGGPPKDPDKLCTSAQRRQPVFDGKASYYNSGLIRYEGARGNTFRVKLATDIAPGRYFFYCAWHGPEMFTEVDVRAKGSDIPSEESVDRRSREEIAEYADPMLKTFREARDGAIEIAGKTVNGPFAGLPAEVEGSINEFVPNTIHAKVGQKVTWKIVGAEHSISFGVPKYFPIISFAKDGTISVNPQVTTPAGGSPKLPEGKQGEVLRVDGGTYGGTGFFSSSVFGGDPYAEYSLRFSKPGTYRLACLIHPPMVGHVVVTA